MSISGMRRGDVYLADLDPTKGFEQSGVRPVLIVQDSLLNHALSTVVVIPFTSNLKRADQPTCVLVHAGDGGLRQDSVLLIHNIRVIDKSGLLNKWGSISTSTLSLVEQRILSTLGMSKYVTS